MDEEIKCPCLAYLSGYQNRPLMIVLALQQPRILLSL